MTIIALLITVSLTIALIFLGVFLWSMKSGQYDDTYTPSVRMLFEDKPKQIVENQNTDQVLGSDQEKSSSPEVKTK